MPFLNDTFTDTDTVVLGSHTGETGATWTKVTGQTGVFTVSTNRVYCTTANALYYASGTPAGADYDVSATIRVASTGLNCRTGVVGRASTGANTNYFCFLERISAGGAMNIRIISVVAGTELAVGSTVAVTPTAGTDHTILLRMAGNQISAYYDGVLTIGPVTDTAVSAAGKAGVKSNVVATTTTGFHIADISASDLKSGKLFVNQAVNRAAYF